MTALHRLLGLSDDAEFEEVVSARNFLFEVRASEHHQTLAHSKTVHCSHACAARWRHAEHTQVFRSLLVFNTQMACSRLSSNECAASVPSPLYMPSRPGVLCRFLCCPLQSCCPAACTPLHTYRSTGGMSPAARP